MQVKFAGGDVQCSGHGHRPAPGGCTPGGAVPRGHMPPRVGAGVAPAPSMFNFPTIGVLPTGTVALESPLLVIGTPALIAFGAVLVVLVGVVGITRVARRQRRTTRARRGRGMRLTLPFGASKGGY